MLATPAEVLARRALSISNRVADGRLVTVAPDTIECGGAALPAFRLTTWTLQLTHETLGRPQLHAALRDRAIIGRCFDRDVVLDLRSVHAEDDASVAQALQALSQR